MAEINAAERVAQASEEKAGGRAGGGRRRRSAFEGRGREGRAGANWQLRGMACDGGAA